LRHQGEKFTPLKLAEAGSPALSWVTH